MKVFLAALIIIGIGVFAMCFNIIFRGKEFPDSDVGTNENMKKMGIRCFKDLPEVTQHHVFHTILDFFRIDSPVFDENLSIFED